MTTRTVSVVFLFVAAMLTAGLSMALALAIGARAEWSLESWLLPLVLFVSFVTIFFLGRAAVLPAQVADSPAKSLGILSAWMAATLLVSIAITWAIGPFLQSIGVGSGALYVLFACLLLSTGVLDRVLERRRRRIAP